MRIHKMCVYAVMGSLICHRSTENSVILAFLYTFLFNFYQCHSVDNVFIHLGIFFYNL